MNGPCESFSKVTLRCLLFIHGDQHHQLKARADSQCQSLSACFGRIRLSKFKHRAGEESRTIEMMSETRNPRESDFWFRES